MAPNTGRSLGIKILRLVMITPKTKYFLISCCVSLGLIITLSNTNEGILYQRIFENITERFLCQAAVLRTNITTAQPPVISVFPNISKSTVTQASARGIYMFTAFKRVLAENKTAVLISGWENKSLKKPSVQPHCCYLLSNGAVVSGPAASTTRFIYNPQLTAVLYQCHVPKDIIGDFAVSLTVVETLQTATLLKHAAPVPPPAPQSHNRVPTGPNKKPVPSGSDNKTQPVLSPGNKTEPKQKPVLPGSDNKTRPVQSPGNKTEPEQKSVPLGSHNKTHPVQSPGNKTEPEQKSVPLGSDNKTQSVQSPGNKTEPEQKSVPLGLDNKTQPVQSPGNKTEPKQKSVPLGSDNKTQPALSPGNKTEPKQKPVPPSPVKNSLTPLAPIKKPNSVGKDQELTVAKSENKSEMTNSSDSNNVSVVLRKLLAANTVVNNKTNEKDIVNNSVIGKSLPVIKVPASIICPTYHGSYVMPFKPIDLINIDTAPGEIAAAPGEIAAAPGENRSLPIKEDLKQTRGGDVGQKNFSFAVCAKIIYGNADVELTIEWMEYYRHMGASKVLAFTHQLSEQAKAVVQHYEDTGFLETMPFDFPKPNSPKRKVGEKNGQAWNDEQVTVYHCYDRLINYKFVGVIDFDEFIVPMKDKNFKELFERLLNSQKVASDFMFPHMVHVQEWKRTRNDSLKIASYLQHTKNLGYNLKTVFIPDRIPEGKLHTHGLLKHLPGYRTTIVGTHIAQMSHYRDHCRPEWVKSGTCFLQPKISSPRILDLLDNTLRRDIEKKKKLLLK